MDRREEDHAPLLVLVQQVHSDLQMLNKTLIEHIDKDAVERKVSLDAAMATAFPGGDAKSHREAHESQMAAIRDRAVFWENMRFEITKYGLFGLLGWLTFVAWSAFIRGPR